MYTLNTLEDKELMMWYQLAIERQDSRYIKAIKEEMNRRNREL